MVERERVNLSDAVERIQKLLFPNSIPRWPFEPAIKLVEYAVMDQIVPVWGVKWLEIFSRPIKQIPLHACVRPMWSDIIVGDVPIWRQVQVDWSELWAYARGWLNANGYRVDEGEDEKPKRGRPRRVDEIAQEMKDKFTPDELRRAKAKELAAEFKTSGATANRARNQALQNDSDDF
jgi:hypothetical protein